MAVRRSTRTPSIGEPDAAAYMPNGRLCDAHQCPQHEPVTASLHDATGEGDTMRPSGRRFKGEDLQEAW